MTRRRRVYVVGRSLVSCLTVAICVQCVSSKCVIAARKWCSMVPGCVNSALNKGKQKSSTRAGFHNHFIPGPKSSKHCCLSCISVGMIKTRKPFQYIHLSCTQTHLIGNVVPWVLWKISGILKLYYFTKQHNDRDDICYD